MRLLLVEDNPSLASGLSLALSNKGFSVNHVSRGQQALAAVENDRPDLVILDLGLPDMDGFDVLRKIRQGESELPVLILTARDAIEHRVTGLDLGADDYLCKPFEIEELEARLRVLERRLGTASTSKIESHNISLDTATLEVRQDGKQVDLSRREYTMLKSLLLNAGKVLTRDSLEDKLYSWGEEVASNAIEVHIHHLRKKLGAQLIKTVRGVGYTIEKP
ncbi:MAG: response regulator [Gammaproteobacteria bacterium]|nr:response regulator [Gammaproteobacteria bacterium]MBQ0838808.1 response regulator [Gammaproteobacteria bacterium]